MHPPQSWGVLLLSAVETAYAYRGDEQCSSDARTNSAGEWKDGGEFKRKRTVVNLRKALTVPRKRPQFICGGVASVVTSQSPAVRPRVDATSQTVAPLADRRYLLLQLSGAKNSPPAAASIIIGLMDRRCKPVCSLIYLPVAVPTIPIPYGDIYKA